MAKSKKIIATGNVRTGAGTVYGFIVSSHTSGTLKLEDSVGGGQDMIMDTFTFAAGSSMYKLPEPVDFQNGLYATLGGSNVVLEIITN